MSVGRVPLRFTLTQILFRMRINFYELIGAVRIPSLIELRTNFELFVWRDFYKCTAIFVFHIIILNKLLLLFVSVHLIASILAFSLQVVVRLNFICRDFVAVATLGHLSFIVVR